jgi:hypothetical protein
MKTRFCLVALLLISVSATIVAYSQGQKKPRTDADYQIRTLSELMTLQPDNIANNPDYQNSKNLRMVVHPALLPSRVKVLYDGTTRPVVFKRKLVITEWANKFAGAPEFYTVPYDTEMLFSENGTSYWLVVKKEFLPKFEQAFKKGDAVALFLIKFGNAHIDEDDKLEPVLLVEKFEKP